MADESQLHVHTPLVSVVDDDASTRMHVERLTASIGFRCRGFASAEEFRLKGDPKTPGCIVLDVCMPGQSGLELQSQLNDAGFHAPIIFLTAFGDVPMAVHAIKAGAADFLTKPCHNDELLAAIRAAVAADRSTRDQSQRAEQLRERFHALTARQRQVMALLVKGHLNKQIAGHLKISAVTVKFHRRQVMERMGASSLVDLVRMAELLFPS